MNIKIKKINQKAKMPVYSTPGSAGCDLVSMDSFRVNPGDTYIVHTGLTMEIPTGFEAQIRSRSGLAAKNSLFVLNSPGTIDPDFRGEVCVILHNAGYHEVFVLEGDRIAQMVIAPIIQAQFEEVDSLDETARGSGGLGSTGK